MNIGIVLSKTPNYSETFFLTKIKGLQSVGFKVVLFVQKKDPQFSLCPVITAPSVRKGQPIWQSIKIVIVFIRLLLLKPKPFLKFLQLERTSNKGWYQIIKNGYNNSHIISSEMDWLHFGFTTMAIESEHVAKAIGAKMAVSFRGFDLTVYPKDKPNCYHRIWQHVDKVHSISNYLIDVAYTLGLPEHIRYQIITPAVDITNFYYGKMDSIKRKKNNIVTVARLHWIKGLADSIKAIAILKQKGIDFKYIIIGDGAEYDTLKALILDLELQNHVDLIGRKTHEEVLEFLKISDLYLQYSEAEGFCNAVLEAQAAGLLCVVSDGGALSENVLHNTTGWVVPKKNPEALADALIKIIDLPKETQDAFRHRANNRVLELFNLELQKQKFKSFYEDY